jgi:D-serine dehydratase
MATDPLQPILDSVLDGRTKGYPLDRPPARLGDLESLGLSLLDGGLDFPAAILHRESLAHNGRWMREFTRRTGATLCPHGKTTMAPQLFHRQLLDGAWGITLATLQEVQVAYRHGIKRVLLANEAVHPGALEWLARTLAEDPDFDCTCLVDSEAGVALLEAAARGRRPLPVLVELGLPDGRTGARGVGAAVALARAVKAAPSLRLRGVECYEGILGSADPQADRERVLAWLEQLLDLAGACDRAELFETGEILLSAGGSAYFDLVAQALAPLRLSRPHRVVLRSGCYFAHDAGHYRRLLGDLQERLPAALRMEQPLRPALEIWGQVLSRPEPGLAFLGLGKRDCGSDLGLPEPTRWHRPGTPGPASPAPADWRVTKLYDQHARLEIGAETDLRVGDLVGCGISHPCTTFDKWDVLFEVDAEDRVVGAIKTFF